MRLILPLIIILVAVGGFVFFTQPILNDPLEFAGDGAVSGGIFALEEQKNVIQTALADAEELSSKIASLNTELNAIDDSDIERLDNFLPDSISDVQLVTDINNIARLSGMKIDNVNIEVSNTRQTRQQAGDLNPELSELRVSFDTEASYIKMREFLNNVSKSLRVLEVNNLSFSVSPEDAGRHTYNVTLTTYWLK